MGAGDADGGEGARYFMSGVPPINAVPRDGAETALHYEHDDWGVNRLDEGRIE